MKKRKLLEASDYENLFGKETFGTLKKKSSESLRQMLGGKNFMQASMEAMALLPQIVKAEEPYRDYLEEIAKDALYAAFPVVKKAGIVVEAKLVGSGELNLSQNPPKKEEEEDDIPLDRLPVDKRRLINAITQGASIRGAKAYHYFRDIISTLDEDLVERYDKILNLGFGIYDDDNAIAMMLAMLSQGSAQQGGESEAEWDEESNTLTIRAKALIFPILVHELVKGLYEIISLHGFTGDPEQNKQIVGKVDKVQNEPEDLRYGKFIYDAITKHYEQSPYKNPLLRELFFTEIYKLDDQAFMSFVENSIQDALEPSQKRWVEKTLKRLESENLD